jgi:hypothetical protein
MQNMMERMMSMFQQMQGNQMQAEQSPLIQFCNQPEVQQPKTQRNLPSYQLQGFKPLRPETGNMADLSKDKDEDSTLPSLSMSEATGALLAVADTAVTAARAPGKQRNMKRPAAKPKAAAAKKAATKPKTAGLSFDSMSAARRLVARPNGCSKCRGKAGCTKSCWTKKTNPW